MLIHRFAVYSSKFGNLGAVWNIRPMTSAQVLASAVKFADRHAQDTRESSSTITVHRQCKDDEGRWRTDFACIAYEVPSCHRSMTR
jgi:hypothetical protein